MVGAWIGLVALLAQAEPGDAEGAPGMTVAPGFQLARESDLVAGMVGFHANGKSRALLVQRPGGELGADVYVRDDESGQFVPRWSFPELEVCERQPFFHDSGAAFVPDVRGGGLRLAMYARAEDAPPTRELIPPYWPGSSCAHGPVALTVMRNRSRYVGAGSEIIRLDVPGPVRVVVADDLAARRILVVSALPETLLVHTGDGQLVRIRAGTRETLLDGATIEDVVATDDGAFITLGADGILTAAYGERRSIVACGVPPTAMLAFTDVLLIADPPTSGSSGDLWAIGRTDEVGPLYLPLRDDLHACPEPSAPIADARPELSSDDEGYGALDPTDSATTTVLAHPVDPHDAETRAAALAAKTLAERGYAFCHEVGAQEARALRAFCGAWTPEARAICPAAAAACVPPPRRWWDAIELPPAVGWALLAGLVFIALAALFKLLRDAARDQAVALDALDAESLRAPVAALPDAPARALLAEARARLAAGDVDAAALLAHLTMLRALDDADVVRFQASRTNREYLRALRRRPEVRDVLAAVAREVEEIRFGRGHADAARVPSLLVDVEATLPRIRAPVPPADTAPAT